MTTKLGIDIGTTFTSASISRDGEVEVLRLEADSTTMASVVAINDDEILVGRDAERQLAERPTSGAREFKRRLGDTTPYVLDGAPYGAEVLTGHLMRAVVDRAGVVPDVVVVAHPANWGEYKLELLRDAGRSAGLGEIELISEPVAAAMHYAANGSMSDGSTIAVYDFGGGTFDVAVVRLIDGVGELAGPPEGLERLGGIDIDQIVLAHVDASLDGALAELDTSDLEVRRGVIELRAACSDAKEALSSDTDVTIPVRLPGLMTEVRMTRPELEAALSGRLQDTLAALDRAVAAADLTNDQLAGVLLVGGSSRIPMVAESVATHTGCNILTDADHRSVISAGAAVGTSSATPDTGAIVEQDGSGRATKQRTSATSQTDKPSRRPGLGTIGRAAAAVGAIGGSAGASYAGWRYFRDGDEERVTEEVVELTSGTTQASSGFAAADDDATGPGQPTITSPTPVERGSTGVPLQRDEIDPSLRQEIFTQTPQGAVTAAVFEAAAARPIAPPPRPTEPAPAPTSSPSQEAPAPRPAPTTAPLSAIVSDSAVEDVRDLLRSRLDELAVPEGASPEDVAKLRTDLDGLLDRYQPYPGQGADDAVAALRYEFEDRVRDFAQDQRIEAVIDEQRRQVEEAQVVETELAEFRDGLQSRLEDWTPPAAADPEEVAELREALEGMIDRATAFPGQSAEDAIANLRLQFNDQVGDFAQDLKIDALVDEQRVESDDDDGEVEAEDPTLAESIDEDETGEDESTAEPATESPSDEASIDNADDPAVETIETTDEQLSREVPLDKRGTERPGSESAEPGTAVLADAMDQVMAGEADFVETAAIYQPLLADGFVANADESIAAQVDLAAIPDDLMGTGDESPDEATTILTAPIPPDPAGGRGVVMDPVTAEAMASEDDVTALDPDLDFVTRDMRFAKVESEEPDPEEVAVDESLAEPDSSRIWRSTTPTHSMRSMTRSTDPCSRLPTQR